MTVVNKQKTIEAVAKEVLGISTLATQNSDSLDFHTFSVSQLNTALSCSYWRGYDTAVRQYEEDDDLTDAFSAKYKEAMRAYELIGEALDDLSHFGSPERPIDPGNIEFISDIANRLSDAVELLHLMD